MIKSIVSASAVLVLGAAVGVSVAGSASAAVPDSCQSHGNETICTFEYSGKSLLWQVPTGVSSLKVELYGAQGGSSGVSRYGGPASSGGLGGYTRATLPVNPDEALQINVGGQATGNAGGFGGGGNGTDSGMGGGGASDVVRSTDGTYPRENRLLIAGGGGGGGGGSKFYSFAGGAGGGLVGEKGDSQGNAFAAGRGATQESGGFGGKGAYGCAGNVGTSGNGGDSTPNCGGLGGGGGGGGYFGGGAGGNTIGYGAGGGGGSGYASVKGAELKPSQRVGNGLIVIRYTR